MKNNRILYIISGIVIFLVIVAAVILAMIKQEKPEPVAETQVIQQQTTTAEETTEEPTTIIYADPVIDFKDLQSVNPDCYAYVDIPDTPISYPVMRSRGDMDDDYYLNITFEGLSGYPGSIYAQQITKADFSNYVSVLYGHDMADGSFFGSLKDFVDVDHFNSHQQMFVYTPKTQFEYKIVAEVTVNDDNISYLFDTMKKGSGKLFWDYIHNGEEENVFDESYQYRSGDRFMVLATCIGWRPDDRRIVVGLLTEQLPVRQ